MKIIKEPEKYDLNDPETNYLILTSPERFIFNDYKTSKTYEQQTINILDPSLIDIINQYIKIKNIQDGEYLITQPTNKNNLIDKGNFSRLITKIFKKALNINTSLDYIRKSHIINFIDICLSIRLPINKQSQSVINMWQISETSQSCFQESIEGAYQQTN